ncbi:MAG: HD domain-containing protein [Alphaproteobacteria bacterium]
MMAKQAKEFIPQHDGRQVSFTQMKDGTREDYEILSQLESPHHALTPDRLLRELRFAAEETTQGYQITRLDHALQSATRAVNDAADDDWVVATLLHDIGDGLAPQNHDRFAAEIIRPFVREEISWTIEHHGLFQMVYYAHHYGWQCYERDKYKNHPYYQTCVDFCERWDQSSFDPAYSSKALDDFEPALRRVFARKPYDEKIIKSGLVLGLPNISKVAS